MFHAAVKSERRLSEVSPRAAMHEPTPAALAAAIARSPSHERTESELKQLRDRLQAIHDEVRALVGQRGDASDAQIVREVKLLEAERLALQQKIGEARVRVRPMRTLHAAAVEKALAPRMARDAGRVLAALAELRAAAAALGASQQAIVAAYGEMPAVTLPLLGEIEAFALRFAPAEI